MIKYFLEIKNRVFLLLLTVFSTLLISYMYKETLLFLITQPERLMLKNGSYSNFYFIFTNVTEILTAYIQLITFIGFQAFLIFSAYHSFMFFSQAMFKSEYNFLLTLLNISVVIWLFSATMSNLFIVPLTWDFFFSFQKLFSSKFVDLHFEARLIEYLDFYMLIYYVCVLYFQIFTILFFFLNCVSNKIKIIRKYRKIYYYCFVIVSTLISPPDFISQFFISLILITIYEALIFIVVLNQKH